MQRTEQVSVPGRSNQPVGMASIGFAAFWPNGGGIKPQELGENNHNQTTMQTPQSTNDDDPVTSGATNDYNSD